MPNFGARLRASMLAAGVTETESLARRVGVSAQVVRKWLRSEKPALSADNQNIKKY